MKISELILAIGDDNVEFQVLDTCADKLNMNGKVTKITFGSEQTLTINGTQKFGLILWLDRASVKAALAQGIEAATADETQRGSAVGESPVVEDHAPEPSTQTHTTKKKGE